MLEKMCISLNQPEELENTFAGRLQSLRNATPERQPFTERPRFKLLPTFFQL